MDDYSGLKPGLYLQVGDSIKTLQDGREYWGGFHNLFTRGTNADPSVETLAGEVAWVWIALQKRKQKILEVPYAWQKNGDDIDDVPFNMKYKELLQQIDTSLQLYSCAYLLKQRGSFTGESVGVRWLDPVLIEPDYDTADPTKGGVQRYKRWYDDRQGWDWIPAGDIIAFIIPGMRELYPDVSAVRATSLTAQILRGMSQTLDTFMDNNALPVMLVKVPQGTAEAELSRIETAFRRLFNSRKGTTDVRTKGVRADIEVITLSFKPSELEMMPLEESKRDAILAAHDVPKSLVLADAATFATLSGDMQNIITSMGSRLDYIAEVFADDRDFEAAGYTLDVRTGDHWAMKEDESQRANAFGQYVTGGFTPKAAAWLVGISIDDFPDDIGEIFKEERVPEQLEAFQNGPQNPPPFGQEQQPMPMNEERDREEAQLKRWAKKRANPNPNDFQAYYLTPEEKEFIIYDVIGERRIDDTFDEFAAMMKRLEPVHSENGHSDPD